MNIIYLAIPMAIVLGSLFLGGFLWAVMKGQYDDVETPAYRILLEDDFKREIDKVEKETT